jgi:hypothetical protein
MDEDGSNPRPYPTIDIRSNFDARKEIFEKGYMAQPSIFFRRDLYERVGGLNPSLKFCMDYDLWAPFAVSSVKFVGFDADISGNRWYATTKTAGKLLDLYAEVVTVQHSIFGVVSPYYVQAVSDYFNGPASRNGWVSGDLRSAEDRCDFSRTKFDVFLLQKAYDEFMASLCLPHSPKHSFPFSRWTKR